MIALPQCLEFPYDDRSREICDYYLQILEIKNKSVFMHSKQVANYSASIAAKIGLPPAEVACIKTAALLHDIGQLSVPNLVLSKVPYLSKREEAAYKRHCLAGAAMLENFPEFGSIISIIRSHHEKFNGTGYPKRLKGQNIPLGARIIAVANYYDRHINPCTQHWQKTHAEAINELKNKSGQDFDPHIVKAFIESVLPASKKSRKE